MFIDPVSNYLKQFDLNGPMPDLVFEDPTNMLVLFALAHLNGTPWSTAVFDKMSDRCDRDPLMFEAVGGLCDAFQLPGPLPNNDKGWHEALSLLALCPDLTHFDCMWDIVKPTIAQKPLNKPFNPFIASHSYSDKYYMTLAARNEHERIERIDSVFKRLHDTSSQWLVSSMGVYAVCENAYDTIYMLTQTPHACEAAPLWLSAWCTNPTSDKILADKIIGLFPPAHQINFWSKAFKLFDLHKSPVLAHSGVLLDTIVKTIPLSDIKPLRSMLPKNDWGEYWERCLIAQEQHACLTAAVKNSSNPQKARKM